ncbi:hypothetical protein SEPCBS57363_000024 [Sporothrix epigloea]|uniref:Uncharacterized protein n=1 Tax=Sporothrix epigloea TaxID=1892477 RepID=A0ABP0D527_9PEZI
MADTLPETDGMLQVPVARSSSRMEDVVSNNSRRSSASRDLHTQGSSSAGSPSLSASTVSSHETPTSTFRLPAAHSSSPIPSDTVPPRLPRRRGADILQISTTSPSSSTRQDYQLSPFSSPSTSLLSARALRSSSHASEPKKHRISHRQNRPSGAFLLTDQLGGGRHGNSSNHESLHTRSDAVQRLSPSNHGPFIDANDGGNFRATHETPKHDSPDQAGSARAQARKIVDSAASYSPTTASPATSASRALELDSAQIVNMALSLSESRRLASRRNVSQQLPPRFAPGPDGANNGTRLRQQQPPQQQQQRRSSRAVSPKPERPLSGRFLSSQFSQPQGIPRASNTYTLQPAFELLPYDSGGGQNAYHYRFSQSTIARAQKAKDYLELLAQQRRLLELIPPLTPGPASRSRATSLGSPPPTSGNSGQPQPLLLAGPELSRVPFPGSTRLGRPYNPLQYIRNRKVRVRERRTIDGEAQGFGDVSKTVEWVDEVARRAATGQDRMLGGYTLPTFASADATAALQSSPPASRVAGQGILAKPKRPRTDWNIDPADMIADVYWLEQGDNKKLVEDRHWRRVFPQDSALYRPMSQKTDESSLSVPHDKLDLTGPFPTMTDDGVPDRSKIKAPLASVLGAQHKELELSPEQDQSSTRKRARQKLNELRTFRHRKTPSYHAHGIARSRRGSFSDTTDSDNDRMQSGQARAALTRLKDGEKLKVSMSDKSSEKAQEKDENAAATAAAAALKGKTRPGPPSTAVVGAAPAPVKIHERDPSVVQSRGIETPGDLQRGRASLELPAFGPRSSLEYDSSRPTSPELRPFSKEGLGFVPPLGGDLSPPSSRAASPPRHRFEKVKSMFRDHSRERERERERERDKDRPNYAVSKVGDDDADLVRVRMRGLPQWQQQQLPQQQDRLDADKTPLATVPPTKDLRFTPSQAEKIFYGPGRDNGMRPGLGTFDSHRSHSSISNSAGNDYNHSHHHNRSEEGGPTLRGLFKGGPRFDVMLRSAGSKVSEMLWRREGSEAPEEDSVAAAHHSSSSSDDDSESEATEPRGRLQKRLSMWSRSPSMTTGESVSRQTAEAGQKHYLDVMPTFGRGSDPVNRPPSRQSARFERLKPPPIDVLYASPSADDASNSQKQLVAQPSSRRNSSPQPPYQQSKQDADYSESEARSRRSSRVSGVASSVHGSLGDGSLQPISRQLRPMSNSVGRNASHPRWSMSQPAFTNRGSLSRREIARLHAFVYSSAVLAKELVRRANEPKPLVPLWHDVGSNRNAQVQPFPKVLDQTATDAGEEDGHDEDLEATQDGSANGPIIVRGAHGETSLTWADIAAYAPDPTEMARRPIKQVEMYPLAAQVLGNAIQRSGASWQKSAEMFANAKVPDLRQRIANVRTRVAVDLSGLARQAADEADEVTHDLMAVQRLQVKRVGDSIEKMLRRRQRRFRWVRRAGWLTVEWLLVGLMWYVWFVVTLARIVLGFGRGVYAGVRWLLWL